MRRFRFPIVALATAALTAMTLSSRPAGEAMSVQNTFPKPPGIERLDPALDKLIAADATIEVLAGGYDWTEGPLWIKDGGYLLFSDIPPNQIHRWKEGEGARLYLTPSGIRHGAARRRGRLERADPRSPGPPAARTARRPPDRGNGRAAQQSAAEVRLARREAWRAGFNSPNDLIVRSNGDIYFTDPAYGLEKQWEDPAREMNYAGVFRRAADGTVTLLTKEMTRPNGLAFSPDERRLYVAQSDSAAAIWRVFDVTKDGNLENSRVLFDATALGKTRSGSPDGLKIDASGNLFATGPGGVLILTPEGKHLGTIMTGQATSNCAFGDDGRTLYMTADDYLMRVKLRTKGLGF